MTQEHQCHKEAELAEIKQLVKSFSNNEQRTYNNWHDIRILQEKQLIYEKQHEETLELIREISKCQQKLIIETAKTNKTFEDMKWVIGLIPVICTGLTFLITYILH